MPLAEHDGSAAKFTDLRLDPPGCPRVQMKASKFFIFLGVEILMAFCAREWH